LDDLFKAFGKKDKKYKAKKAKYPYGKPKGKKAWYGYGPPHGPGYGGYGHGPAGSFGPRGGSLVDKGLRMLIDKVAGRAGYHPDRRQYGHDDVFRGYPPPGYGFGKRRRRDWDDD
jgi:hypothetical protein